MYLRRVANSRTDRPGRWAEDDTSSPGDVGGATVGRYSLALVQLTDGQHGRADDEKIH